MCSAAALAAKHLRLRRQRLAAPAARSAKRGYVAEVCRVERLFGRIYLLSNFGFPTERGLRPRRERQDGLPRDVVWACRISGFGARLGAQPVVSMMAHGGDVVCVRKL